jgi:hypothetical protein
MTMFDPEELIGRVVQIGRRRFARIGAPAAVA